MSEYAFEGAKRSSASIAWSFATQTFPYDSSTPFSRFITGPYQGVIVAAFARWAAVSGLTFTQVPDAAGVPIRIGFEAFALPNELGETDYRYSKGVLADGTLVRLLDPASVAIVPDASGTYVYQRSQLTLFQVVLHEIGHALGLDHTTDPGTIMYPYATTANQDLAAGDIEGINTLYPYYTVQALNPVQIEGGTGQTDLYDFSVTRFSDPSLALTVNYAVTGAAYPALSGSAAASALEFAGGAYPAGQLTFAAGSRTATLSVAVAGNTIAQPDQGFAIALSSQTAGDSVTVRGMVNALVLDDDGYGQVNGQSLGVYRFFSADDGTHFYSTSQTERNTLIQTRPDLVYEGLGLTAIASPAADPAAVPVFRFFDRGNGTHFYSISPGERDMILATRADLSFEGTAFYEHSTAQTGDVPVYRFFDIYDGTHFYTANAAERASILATRSDLRDEGVGFYAPTT